MFGDILIDKIRINLPVYRLIQKKININSFQRWIKVILSKYFFKGAFNVTLSRNQVKITLTPTRFKPISDYTYTDVNLEMPSEEWLYDLLKELGCFNSENRRIVEACKVVKLHLTKNLITKHPVITYTDSLSNRTYKRMKANIIESNETNRTLSIATPKRDRKVKNTNGDRQFILYDKSQQLRDKAGFEYVILKTPLNEAEKRLIPLKYYSEQTGYLRISKLNIARLELQYANSSKLKKLAQFITSNKEDTGLQLCTLLDLLEEGNLYFKLEQFYTEELREYIFFNVPQNEPQPATRWNGLFAELINNADIKSLIALYSECTTEKLNNKGNFMTAVKEAQKTTSDELYAELYNKLGIAETVAVTV